MEKTTVRAYAKVNLLLDITGKGVDGYHILDMIVSSIDLYDNITVQKRDDNEISITMLNFEDIPDNIAFRTASLLQKKYNLGGMDIFIKKNIPIGAGLGGSSADACGTARAIMELFNLSDIDDKLLQKLGSDIPCMLKGGLNRVQGIGEIISSLPYVPMYFVVLYPQVSVMTSKVYKNFKQGFDRASSNKMMYALEHKNIEEVKRSMYNTLYESTIEIEPKVAKLMKYAKSIDSNAIMTGSGSSVIILCKTLEEAKDRVANIDIEVEKFVVSTVETGTVVY